MDVQKSLKSPDENGIEKAKSLWSSSPVPSILSENVSGKLSRDSVGLDELLSKQEILGNRERLSSERSDLYQAGRGNLSSFSTTEGGNTSADVSWSSNTAEADSTLHTLIPSHPQMNSLDTSVDKYNDLSLGSSGVSDNVTWTASDRGGKAGGAPGAQGLENISNLNSSLTPERGAPQWARQSADVDPSSWPGMSNISVSYTDCGYSGDMWPWGSLGDPFLNCSMNQTSIDSQNGTTEEPMPEGYLSGYSLAHVILASIFVTLLMIVIVFGNGLVIVAIAKDRHLKNIQNWFIASLAASDLLVGKWIWFIYIDFNLIRQLNNRNRNAWYPKGNFASVLDNCILKLRQLAKKHPFIILEQAWIRKAVLAVRSSGSSSSPSKG